MPSVDVLQIIIAVLVVGGAAFAQGLSGFGFGILATALFSMYWPSMERATVLATLVAVAVQGTLIAATRKGEQRIDWRTIVLLMAGAAVGIPVGYALLLHGQSTAWFRVVFGLALLGFAVNGWWRPHVRRPIPSVFGPVVGVISGIISGAFSSGGPPLVLYIYAREHDPRLAKGTLQATFIVATLTRLVIVQSGRYPVDRQMLQWMLIVVPGAVVMALLGHWLSQRVSVRLFCWAVYALVALAGLVQIGQGLGK